MDLSEVVGIIERFARLECSVDSSLDYDSVVSDSTLKYWENRDKIISVENGGNPRALLRMVVRNAAHDYRTREEFHSCQYTYRSDTVRKILTDALSEQTSARSFDGTDLELDDLPVVRSDVRSCLAALQAVDRAAIIDRYYVGNIPGAGSAQRKRLDRAVRRLVRVMNNYHGSEVVGSRRARTISSSIAEISNLTG